MQVKSAQLAAQCQRLSPDLRYQLAVRLRYHQVIDVDESLEICALFPNLLSNCAEGSYNPLLFWSQKCRNDFGVTEDEFLGRAEIGSPWQIYLYFAQKHGFFYPGYEHGPVWYLKAVIQAIKKKRYNWVKYFLSHWQVREHSSDKSQIVVLLAKAVLTGDSKMVNLLKDFWQQRIKQATLPGHICQQMVICASRVGNQEWVNGFQDEGKLTQKDFSLVDRLVVTGAIRAGRIEELQEYKRLYPKKRNLPYWLALACRSGNLPLAQYLLPAGKRQVNSGEPLRAALRSGNQELIKMVYARTAQSFVVGVQSLAKVARKGGRRRFKLLDWFLKYSSQHDQPEHIRELYLELIKTGTARSAVGHLERKYGALLLHRRDDQAFYKALLKAGLEGKDREAIEQALDCLPRARWPPFFWDLVNYSHGWAKDWLQGRYPRELVKAENENDDDDDDGDDDEDSYFNIQAWAKLHAPDWQIIKR